MANNFNEVNCRALWRFEDGALTADSKGTNTLTSYGTPVVNTVDYKEGAACVDFEKDDAADYFSITDANLNTGFPFKIGDTTKKMSICFWLKLEAPWQGYQLIISKGTWSASTISFSIGVTGTQYDPRIMAAWYGAGRDAATRTISCGDYNFQTGIWYHVGVTYDDAGNAGHMRLWDGSTIRDYTADFWQEAVTLKAGPIYIGAGDTTGALAWWLDGLIDELVIFDKILTSAQIDAIRLGIYPRVWQAHFVGASSMSADMDVVNFSPLVGQWTYPVRERLGFFTEILQPHDRVTEQRIAHRCDGSGNVMPAQELLTEIVVRGDDACARFDTVSHMWLKRSWPVPLWPMAELHRGPLPSGSNSIAVDTQYADYRAGSYAMIWQSDAAYEIVKTSAVTGASLSLSSNTVKSYSGDKWIMPCRLGWLLDRATAKRYPFGSFYEMTWEVDADDLSALTGYTADLTYDGLTVLTDPAFWPGDHGEFDCDPDIAVMGGKTGPFVIISNSDFNESTQSHVWQATSKQAAWELRQFLYSIKGRQKPFLVPTFREDLTLTRACGGADTTIYVGNKGFAARMGLNAMRTYLAFRPPDAEIIVRKIIGMTEISDSEETLTLASAPGAAFGPGATLCWVDKCRLASDEVILNWRKRGSLECSVNLARVT